MDRMAEDRTAHLVCPFSAPGHIAITGLAVPMGFKRRNARRPQKPQVLHPGQPSESATVAVREYGKQAATRCHHARPKAIYVGQAARDGFFADSMLARRQRPKRQSSGCASAAVACCAPIPRAPTIASPSVMRRPPTVSQLPAP